MDLSSDHYVTAQDGLRLHVREHGDRTAPGLPVVCLPGLARTTADFDQLAAVDLRSAHNARLHHQLHRGIFGRLTTGQEKGR